MSDKERALEDPIPGASYLPSGMPPNRTGSPGPMPMGPVPSLDPYSMASDGQEGYDFTFEPRLETKYECPICLMCLREPVQTECGHRFCRSCIMRSLRDAGRRCPVDNSPLTEQRCFPDVCVKREILDLKAHCPFRDCPEILELRNMDAHQEDCRFGTLVCPHQCGVVVRRKSIDNHIRNLCPKRRVLCDHCATAVPLDELQVHVDVCMKAPSQCNHCGEAMLREQLQPHVKTNCPAVVVDCRYRSVGCMQRMERSLMGEHLTTAMQLHMDLLASKLDQMNIASAASYSYVPTSYSPHTPTSDAIEYVEHPPGGASAVSSVQYQKDYRRMTDSSSPDTIEIAKYGARTLDQSLLEKTHKYMGGNAMGSMMPMSSKIQGGLQRHPSNVSDSGDQRLSMSESPLEIEVRQLKEKVQMQQRDIVQQNQELLVLRANVERGQQDAKKVKELTDNLSALESRLCNGEFYWKLHGYSDMVREAQRGETSVRHSKGFYTSFYGYKLCLRVNINVSENSHNSHVSLFVHFLKGEFDDLLDWPFSGKITLTIMDQNQDSSKRKPISETLLSKADLAAFHRPRTHRNHKGFGYMEFAPVNMLDAGTFIKDDYLLIKVLVEVKKV